MWLLEMASSRYRRIMQAYLLVSVAVLLVHVMLSLGSLEERVGFLIAVVIGSAWMFWGGFLVLGMKIRFQGYTQFVRFAATFGLWFFSLGTLVGLAWAFKGEQLWPFAVLVPPATALGILRAWAKVKPLERNQEGSLL